MPVRYALIVAAWTGLAATVQVHAAAGNRLELFDCPTTSCDDTCRKTGLSVEFQPDQKSRTVAVKTSRAGGPEETQTFSKCFILDHQNWNCTDSGAQHTFNATMSAGRYQQMSHTLTANKSGSAFSYRCAR